MRKIINHTLILIMTITSIMYLVNNISIGAYSRILPCVAIIPVILIPKMLNKLNFKLTDTEETLYYLFIFIAHFLGAVVNCYDKIWFFAILAHTLSGMLAFMFGIKLLKLNNKEIKLNIFNIIFLLSFCFLISSGWEIIEFLGDCIFKSNFQHFIDTGVVDTIEDIICAFIGYIATIMVYIFNSKKTLQKESDVIGQLKKK